ncbi:hypothetical protein SMICM17S_04471 [Streptomyces microflavus]
MLHRLRGVELAPAGLPRHRTGRHGLLPPEGTAGARTAEPVWEQVEGTTRSEGRYPPSFYLYLVVAGMIGSARHCHELEHRSVAAMVVGPSRERWRWGSTGATGPWLQRAGRPGHGFLTGRPCTFLFALLIRGLVPGFDRGLRPAPNLMNFFSVAVATLAGIVTRPTQAACRRVHLGDDDPGRRGHRCRSPPRSPAGAMWWGCRFPAAGEHPGADRGGAATLKAQPGRFLAARRPAA